MLDYSNILGTCDVLLMTLDTLRYDVARDEMAAGRTPNLAAILPNGQWEPRHSPASFTYASHHAFFAGFLPTPITPGPHPRLFAAKFAGSETTTAQTCCFDSADIVSGFANAGYRTFCIGGVGFFNKLTPLGTVLPGLFQESYWRTELGVTAVDSTENQVRLARSLIAEMPIQQRLFLFINISAIHQPNRFYLPGATEDSIQSHAAALQYVDGQLLPLFSQLRRRGSTVVIICSDHGTAYGEDGYQGHRLAHPVVWTVPYAEFILPGDK
jgi:hypothetical protein